MLNLKNVSKFYYSKGVIASGFTKVSASFDTSEFVVITGESGSGKSTLLNVISGLDSYEEGEMYINGHETSHYGEADFEEYRKKYVSNIFQHFNLVNSYSVYQNVELVLLMNGYKKKEVKERVLELIKKVGLSRYKNTKVSKLSGGQKQRVAIARALAKETPIIVCDEPTANLDSKSSKEIIKLLKEISKDKLLIMVTHDYSSVEDIATRVIKMHDGKILSDRKLDSISSDKKIEVTLKKNRNIGFLNIIRLGVRNTFNIIPKFVLMFIVFFFITASLLTEYGAMRRSEYESSKLGYNYFFNDRSDTRIVIKKLDGSEITDSDFARIKSLDSVSHIVEHDIMLDEYLWFDSMDDNGYYLNGLLRNIDDFNEELDYGRMPENDNEVVVKINEDDYIFGHLLEESIKSTYYLNGDKGSVGIKVVGVKYIPVNVPFDFSYGDYMIYGTDGLLERYMKLINRNYSQVKVNINGQNYESYSQAGYEYNISVSDKVKSGNVIVSENISYACKDYECKNKNIVINVDNLNYKDSLNLKISNVYNDKNIKDLVGISKDNIDNGSIFISLEDYNKIFNRNSYQSSVFAKKVDQVDDLAKKLEGLGFDTLKIKDALNNDGADTVKVLKIVKLVVTVILIVTLFFISYFVIKLILKSRNVYFSTLRILGATARNTKRILDIELLINSSLAYITYIGFILLIKNDILNITFIKNIVEYLNMGDYILMYIILILMSYLISTRFSSKIFKKSAMKSYREEV